MDYIYIDESGDLGGNSNYFVIGLISIKNNKKFNRIIPKIRRNTKKKLGNEIKGNKTHKDIKIKILNRLNNLNYEVITIVFNVNNKYKLNYENNYNLLYDLIASELAKEININAPTTIFVDRSKPKEKFVNDFNNMFLNNLNNPNNYSVKIYHKNSIEDYGLQIIDIIVLSVFQSFERKNNEFIDILNNKKIKLVFED